LSGGAILIFSAEVVQGKEDELNKWYNEHHIPLFAQKLPGLRKVRRFYSKRADPQFLAIYEFDSFEELKKSLASEEMRAAAADAESQKGILINSSKSVVYDQIYPK
jgi:uncharacterized protein (TIGR02118 family)